MSQLKITQESERKRKRVSGNLNEQTISFNGVNDGKVLLRKI